MKRENRSVAAFPDISQIMTSCISLCYSTFYTPPSNGSQSQNGGHTFGAKSQHCVARPVHFGEITFLSWSEIRTETFSMSASKHHDPPLENARWKVTPHWKVEKSPPRPPARTTQARGGGDRRWRDRWRCPAHSPEAWVTSRCLFLLNPVDANQA